MRGALHRHGRNRDARTPAMRPGRSGLLTVLPVAFLVLAATTLGCSGPIPNPDGSTAPANSLPTLDVTNRHDSRSSLGPGGEEDATGAAAASGTAETPAPGDSSEVSSEVTPSGGVGVASDAATSSLGVALDAEQQAATTASSEARPTASHASATGLFLLGHAVLDETAGRVYASAMDGQDRLVTAVYATDDGRLLHTIDGGGVLAVDPTRQRVYVERRPGGLDLTETYGRQDSAGRHATVMPAGRRELATFGTADFEVAGVAELPDSLEPVALTGPTRAPVVDTQTGHVLVFRGPTVLRVDPETGQALTSFDTAVVYSEGDRRAGDGPVPIERAFIDPPSRLVYLSFATRESAPWAGHTIDAYHLDTFVHLGRGEYDTDVFPAAEGGRLFGQTWNRNGFAVAWQWRDGAPFSTRMGAAMPPIGTAVDVETDRLFAVNTTHVRVLDIDTMLPQRTVPHGLDEAHDVWLVGHDRTSGKLVFVADGALYLLGWP